MSNGYFPNSGYILEEEDIKKIVPELYIKFEELVSQNSEGIDFYYFDDEDTELGSLVLRIQEEVENRTGLIIEPYYHDIDNYGDRYDEIDNLSWLVNNAVTIEPTKEAKKAKELYNVEPTYRRWVYFG